MPANGTVPFRVPSDIVDVNRTDLSEDKVLSDFVEVSSDYNLPSITIKNSGGQTVYSLGGFILDQYFNYIEATAFTAPRSKGILGLFERTGDELFLGDGVYSLWSRDTANPVETRTAPGQQEYGSHPYYMGRAPDDSWFGVYTNLAAAQDWWIKNDAESGEVSVRTVAAGGLGDVFIMMAETPDEVTKLYHSIVGKPVLPPQWALGWHQCRWGYRSTEELAWVVGNYSAQNLPLDTQWSDIDWMQDYRDFEFDPDHYASLSSFVDGLHNKNMHYIPIVDAGIALRDDYDVYNDGLNKDVFIKTYDGSEAFTGRVWPNDAVYPDFFNPDAKTWWKE
jgi:alpha-glucosidase (family GH31 glycosyl hydrolase)